MRARVGAFLHWLFEASLLAKGLFALTETLSGVVLLVLRDGYLVELAQRVTLHELSEDPRDVVANALLHGAQSLSVETQSFYGIYLLSHGGLKLAAIVLLMRGILWAYPAAIALLGAFIAYQLYLWSLHHDPMMLALTALDLLVIALTWREWRVRRGLSFGGR
ncbi:DUF2127 domain-containing protein [Sinirhodobacter sp. WL0062]|uniref:DUF2127 domain-containing protein n=1 Tax=Rhodobacter flavimaris TaxID=2907145 RepID=A0ABS8YSB3_9RHOB|nr:DUF2127 domain-containing protein [Sinirhodobacter sp. WL0062]MCE5971985.1 DUF2127 domain-containing protein [Sinirhodobacter sp. WL0062]